MVERPQKRGKTADGKAWAAFRAEPSFHEGEEEVWQSDPLVAVGKEGYPPRFRLALTCHATGVTACVPVRISQGRIDLAPAEITPSNARTCGAALHGTTAGQLPPLARIIAMVPDAIKVTPDGGWKWVAAGWGWGIPTPPELLEKWAREPQPAATSGQQQRFAEQQGREAQRVQLVKHRMSDAWREDHFPRLLKVAEVLGGRGISHTELKRELRANGWGRTLGNEDVRDAAEIGLIPTEDGHPPRYELPWAEQVGLTGSLRRPSGKRCRDVTSDQRPGA